MKRGEEGYIVVETVGCLTLFVLLMAAILSLINIVTVQTRIHYALTQAAETVSMYSYALEKTGLAEPLMGIAESADKTQGEIDEFKSSISDLIGSLNDFASGNNTLDDYVSSAKDVYSSGKDIAGQIKELSESDPESVLKALLNYGLDRADSELFGLVLRPLISRYLSNGTMSGDEFLKTFGVKDGKDGLKFTTNFIGDLVDLDAKGNGNSRLLTPNGDVRIVVTYKIDFSAGMLPLPAELEITQEVRTKAWLGGDK